MVDYAPMIGTDVLEPTRLRDRLAARPALRTQLFTARELAYCDRQYAPHLHLAARYCAKEAVTKALAMDSFSPLDIEVVPGQPAPSVMLHGPAHARAEQLSVSLHVSMSHVEAMAIAVAVGVRQAWWRRRVQDLLNRTTSPVWVGFRGIGRPRSGESGTRAGRTPREWLDR